MPGPNRYNCTYQGPEVREHVACFTRCKWLQVAGSQSWCVMGEGVVGGPGKGGRVRLEFLG